MARKMRTKVFAALIGGALIVFTMNYIVLTSSKHSVTNKNIVKESDEFQNAGSLLEVFGGFHKQIGNNFTDKGSGKKIINPFDFPYMINNETKCAGVETLYYIIYLHSAPKNFKRRDSIRNTWGQENILGANYPSRIIFMLGNSYNNNTQLEIQSEADKFGDIIQQDYKDDYHNLTYKGMGALKWISTYCNKVKYILKSDDDIFIDIFYLHQVLSDERNVTERFLMGAVWNNNMPILRPETNCAKWCVGRKYFPTSKFYPKYCAGGFFIISGDLPGAMFYTALRTPFFWVDDVYISGVIPRRMFGVRYIDFGKHYQFNEADLSKQYLDHDANKMLYFATLTQKSIKFWLMVLEHLPQKDIELISEMKYKKLLYSAEINAN